MCHASHVCEVWLNGAKQFIIIHHSFLEHVLGEELSMGKCRTYVLICHPLL